MAENYVYDNCEVVLTGRKSVKKLNSGREDILFEATPADRMSGSWKKWVRMSDLYEIITKGDSE